jgi:hypothetical protein
MHRIDSNGAAVALPTPGAVGSTVGYFTEGNPATAVPATVVSADWLNAVQEEIVNAITAAGLSPSKTSRVQLTAAIRALAAGHSPKLNVKDYGAVGDGSTDDTAAIIACFADAAGKTVFFPKGTYKVTSQGTLYSGVGYCIRPTVADVVVEGEGVQSIIKISAHESTAAIFALNKASGSWYFKNLQISSPTRVNTTHVGPMAISFGEMGNTSESGALDQFIMEDCYVQNTGFWLHGEGVKRVWAHHNYVVQQAGGTYAGGYIQEMINLASYDTASQKIIELNICDNYLTPDSTNGDHVLYALGPIDHIVFDRNEISAASADETLKVFANSGDAFKSISFVDNLISGDNALNGSAAIVLSGPGIAESLTVKDNRCPVAGHDYFLYSEFQFQNAEVIHNTAKSLRKQGVLFIQSGGIALAGICTVEKNNFANYNTLDTGLSCIEVDAFQHVVIENNILTEHSLSSGYTCLIGPSVGSILWARVEGNVSTAQVPAWIHFGNPTNIIDLNNSWNGKAKTSYQSSLVTLPTTNTFVNITSLALPAGDFLLHGDLGYSVNTGTGVTQIQGAISTNSANTTTDHAEGSNFMLSPAVPSGTADGSIAIAGYPLRLTVATTVYLKAAGSFSGGAIKALGRLTAIPCPLPATI